jgi:hypothetical protein
MVPVLIPDVRISVNVQCVAVPSSDIIPAVSNHVQMSSAGFWAWVELRLNPQAGIKLIHTLVR